MSDMIDIQFEYTRKNAEEIYEKIGGVFNPYFKEMLTLMMINNKKHRQCDVFCRRLVTVYKP